MTSRLYVDALWQDTLKHQMLMRLLTKFELGLTRQPIDLEYFEFICRNEVYLWNALSRHIDMLAGLLEALEGFFLQQWEHAWIWSWVGISNLTKSMGKLVALGTKLMKIRWKSWLVSERTLFRRMKEFQLSARNFSNITDEQLDNVVQAIKTEMPTAGYRIVRGRLRSMNINVQWRRVAATMHRVDSLGILSRLSGLGCIIRRTYSMRGPLSLWHVDTNHKLIRSVRVLLV